MQTPHLLVRAQTRIFLVRKIHTALHFSIVDTPRWFKVKGICVAHFSALISISFFMSLMDGPLGRFPRVTSSPTSFAGRKLNPCASARWSGMSGCLANPTPNTGYFYSYVNEEHTPINLPDSHRSFQCRDDATTEDPEGFPHSAASSSSQQTAASRLPQC